MTAWLTSAAVWGSARNPVVLTAKTERRDPGLSPLAEALLLFARLHDNWERPARSGTER